MEDTDQRNGGTVVSNKVFIRQIPPDSKKDELEDFIGSTAGEFETLDHTGNETRPTAVVTFSSPDQASDAIQKINETEFQGTLLRANYFMDRSERGRSGMRGRGGRASGGAPMGPGGDYTGRSNNNNHNSDMPLRMVVDARYVGAIIGQGGSNIREITKESKARCVVDVQRGVRDQSGNMEKVINIYGQPDNCSKACIRILNVVQREAEKEAAGETVEPELKLRAHNQLVGRLIGKGGVTIKKIMEDTNCTIFVSNDEQAPPLMYGGRKVMEFPPVPFHHSDYYHSSISELNAFNMERTITVRGTMENITQAEEKISGKLRMCWENDVANAPQMMYGGGHPLIPPMGGGMPPGAMDPYAGGYGGGAPHNMHYGGGPGVPIAGGAQGGPMGGPAGPRGGHQQPLTEVIHMWVPNNIVGALIGTKGVHIRNVMRLTGAHIRIEGGTRQDEGQGGHDRAGDERLVTITGTDAQQYKAQFWIYQRVCEQNYNFFDEVRLCTEVSVPTKLVGRIIGKGGQNVRELQRLTGAQVKIPEEAATADPNEQEETIVRVIGNFNASQAVQARIRQLIHQYSMQQMRGDRD